MVDSEQEIHLAHLHSRAQLLIQSKKVSLAVGAGPNESRESALAVTLQKWKLGVSGSGLEFGKGKV